jgi:hypothetical protein
MKGFIISNPGINIIIIIKLRRTKLAVHVTRMREKIK